MGCNDAPKIGRNIWRQKLLGSAGHGAICRATRGGGRPSFGRWMHCVPSRRRGGARLAVQSDNVYARNVKQKSKSELPGGAHPAGLLTHEPNTRGHPLPKVNGCHFFIHFARYATSWRRRGVDVEAKEHNMPPLVKFAYCNTRGRALSIDCSGVWINQN